MPEVSRNAFVTLVTLVYRDPSWLQFVMDSVAAAKTAVCYRWLVVANDATEEVRRDPRINVDFHNDNPTEFYINRVYRAWNEGVLNAPTQLVVMLNDDMWVSDDWLDELVALKRQAPKSLPTSLLVESGRLPSGMPEHVRDFGRTPATFQRDAFTARAESIRKYGKTEPGRLYMPILVDRQEFADVGGYPEGNPPGTTGDKDLVRRYTEAGFKHVTALGSVVYHVQLGEQRETRIWCAAT